MYRILLSSCSSSCKCSSECTNKPFQQRHIKKMKLVQVGLLQFVVLYKECIFNVSWISCCLQTEKCGYGIVADEDINSGEFIIEYVGEGDVITFGFSYIVRVLLWLLCLLLSIFLYPFLIVVIDDKICEERLWKLNHKVETNFYLCQINWNMVIDATHKGNKSRYINHSCSPNTEMQKWFVCNLLSIFSLFFCSKQLSKVIDHEPFCSHLG